MKFRVTVTDGGGQQIRFVELTTDGRLAHIVVGERTDKAFERGATGRRVDLGFRCSPRPTIVSGAARMTAKTILCKICAETGQRSVNFRRFCGIHAE